VTLPEPVVMSKAELTGLVIVLLKDTLPFAVTPVVSMNRAEPAAELLMITGRKKVKFEELPLIELRSIIFPVILILEFDPALILRVPAFALPVEGPSAFANMFLTETSPALFNVILSALALIGDSGLVVDFRFCKFKKLLFAVIVISPPVTNGEEELIVVFGAELILPKVLLIVMLPPEVVILPRLLIP